jgi:hypothetical protein
MSTIETHLSCQMKPKKKGMRPQSAKAKGRRLQQYVAREMVHLFPEVLDYDDCRSTSMGASGDDVQLSPLAQKIIPCDFECKNVEDITIWSVIKQCLKRHNPERVPTVVAGRNRRKAMVVIPFGWLYRTIEDTHHNIPLAPSASDFSFGFGPSLVDKLHNLVGIDDMSWRGKKLKVVETKTMKFWKEVDESGHEILIFNRGNASHIIWSVISWDLYVHVLRKHAETNAAHRLVPATSPRKRSANPAEELHEDPTPDKEKSMD